MHINVEFRPDSKQVCFVGYPGAWLEYETDASKTDESFYSTQVTDEKTKGVSVIFFRGSDLQRIGISLTLWQGVQGGNPGGLPTLIQSTCYMDSILKKAISVLSKHLSSYYLKSFIDKISCINQVITKALYQRIERLSKIAGIPGVYFHKEEPYPESFVEIFVNLKKIKPLGMGGYGRVKLVLWLNAPNGSPQIIVKKVLIEESESMKRCFDKELKALKMFSGKNGIISLIAGGIYEGKRVLFFLKYTCSLHASLTNYLAPTFHEKLIMISQWLEGLKTISEQGIHGDLSSGNLLLKMNEEGEIVEAVIADFGAYRQYGEEEYGLTTYPYAPPEYYAPEKVVSSKQDVWAMGICLCQIYEKKPLPFLDFDAFQMKGATAKMMPGWSLEYLAEKKMPPFLLPLINKMLDPRPEYRPSALKVFERFSIGLAAYQNLVKVQSR